MIKVLSVDNTNEPPPFVLTSDMRRAFRIVKVKKKRSKLFFPLSLTKSRKYFTSAPRTARGIKSHSFSFKVNLIVQLPNFQSKLQKQSSEAGTIDSPVCSCGLHLPFSFYLEKNSRIRRRADIVRVRESSSSRYFPRIGVESLGYGWEA